MGQPVAIGLRPRRTASGVPRTA